MYDEKRKMKCLAKVIIIVISNLFFSYFYRLYTQLQGIHQFIVCICYIINDVNAILVKKRERHVLMHALGVFARIQAQSPISDSNGNDSNDSNARD